MLLFILGMFCGAIVLASLLWWWHVTQSVGWSGLHARQALADVERQTVRDLFATEFAARQAGHRPGSGTDIIEGTADDIAPS